MMALMAPYLGSDSLPSAPFLAATLPRKLTPALDTAPHSIF